MLISETQFIRKSYIQKNYRVYDNQHPDGKARGYTAIIINVTTFSIKLYKNSFKHNLHDYYQFEHIQARNVTVED